MAIKQYVQCRCCERKRFDNVGSVFTELSQDGWCQLCLRKRHDLTKFSKED